MLLYCVLCTLFSFLFFCVERPPFLSLSLNTYTKIPVHSFRKVYFVPTGNEWKRKEKKEKKRGKKYTQPNEFNESSDLFLFNFSRQKIKQIHKRSERKNGKYSKISPIEMLSSKFYSIRWLFVPFVLCCFDRFVYSSLCPLKRNWFFSHSNTINFGFSAFFSLKIVLSICLVRSFRFLHFLGKHT